MSGIDDIREERLRQIEKEGYDTAHDKEHNRSELLQAANCYLEQVIGRRWVFKMDGELRYQGDPVPADWPGDWSEEHWKPKNPRRDLVRAAALIVAEIDRMDAELKKE